MNETRKDFLKWVAAACALIATASAEYEIARACGISQWVAWTVPGALDAYALRAIAAHREVLTAVAAMVAVNAASHLVTAGILDVSWILVSAVSAIPPLVLWRVHALWTPSEHRKRARWRVPASVPQSVLTHGHEHGTGHAGTSTGPDTLPVPGHGPSTPDTQAREHGYGCPCPECASTPPSTVPGPSTETLDEHADTAIAVSTPDYVPEEWTQAPGGVPGQKAQASGHGHGTEHAPDTALDTCEHGHPSTHRAPCPSCIEREREHASTPDTGAGTGADTGAGTDTDRARVLALVPGLPPGYRTRTGVSDAVHAADMEALGTLLAHIGEHAVPVSDVGVRDVKDICRVGTGRAQRVLDLLKEAGT